MSFLRQVVFISLFIFGPWALAQETNPAPYARQILQEGESRVYVVGPRAPHLFMVSRDIFGTERRWKEIARLNSLKEPYHLEMGQKLRLPKDPPIDENQANQILIREWRSQGEMDKVRAILALIKDEEGETAAAAAPETASTSAQVTATASSSEPHPQVHMSQISVTTSATVTTQTTQEAPKKLRRLRRLPKPDPAIAPVTTTQAPATPHETKAAVLAPQPDSVPEKPVAVDAPVISVDLMYPWVFSLKLKGTLSELTHDKPSVTVDPETYRTALDPGLSFEAEHRLSPSWKFFGEIGVDNLDITSHKELDLSNRKMSLMHFSLGYGYELSHRFDLFFGAGAEQMVFSQPAGARVDVKAVMIPELHLGSHFLLFDGINSRMEGLIQISSLLPTNVFDQKLKAGLSAALGLQMSHGFESGSLLYGLTLRAIEQNAEDLKSQQTLSQFFLGWRW